jgi:hypothetical protein
MAFDPDTVVREGLLLASIVILFLLAAIVALVARTRSLPVCRNCGFQGVRRAHSHHDPWDTFARVCFLFPHRCEKCLRRFYCFGSHRVRRHSGNQPMAAGQ